MSKDREHASILLVSTAPTGIQGLDEIIRGGLPAGRTMLVCGAAGSGKTLLAVTFLANGARTSRRGGRPS